MLERLDVSELHCTVQGLFHKGSASYVHFLAHLRTPDGVGLACKYLEKDKSLLTKKDSLGNTLLHYAAYLRNTLLIEELISKFSQHLFAHDSILENLQGNTPLHLAVSIKRST
jgi:ankyrin repeat protein